MVRHLTAHNSAGAASAPWHQGGEQPERPMQEARPQCPTSSARWASAEGGWSKPSVDPRVAIIARRSEHYTMPVMSSGQIGLLGMITSRPCTHSAIANTTNASPTPRRRWMVQDDSAQHSMGPAHNTGTTQGRHRNTEGSTAAGSLRSVLVAVPAPLRAIMDLHIQPCSRGGCGSNGCLLILVMTPLLYYQGMRQLGVWFLDRVPHRQNNRTSELDGESL